MPAVCYLWPSTGRSCPPIDIFLRLFAVAALVAANAFYVAGEFGLVAVNRATVERMAEEGDRRAGRVLRTLTRLSFHLSGAQLGITVTSLVLGFISEPAIAVLLDRVLGVGGRGLSVTLALALATAFQMVFGELVPKNVAIARPLQVAFSVGPAMAAANQAVAPLITFLNNAANRTVRMLGIEPREEILAVRSLEELELMIESSAQEGGIDPAEARLLERSLEFPRKVAGEVMTPRTQMVAVDLDATVAELVERAVATGKSRFPVVAGDADHVEGVVHVKDVFRIPAAERRATPVTAVMRPAMVVPESLPLDMLLREMRASGNQLAVVVDEYGGTAGVVTVEDLVEEIVGDIEDEYDERAGVDAFSAPTGVLPGTANRFEVEEATGLVLPEGRFETLAGFILSQLGRVARRGDRVEYEGWVLEVLATERYRVAEVRVIPPRGAT